MQSALLAAALAAPPPAAETDPAAAPPPTVTIHLDGTEPAERGPAPQLLREGSRVVDLRGRLEHDEASGGSKLVIEPSDARAPRHELILIPCALLEELDRMKSWARDERLVFRVSGEIFAYRGRNFLLMTHPPLLVEHGPIAGPPAPGEAAPSAVVAPPAAAAADDDSAQAIMRRLEEKVGPVARRVPAETEGADVALAPMREGAMIVARRGQVRRSARGAFVFVFDADAEGLADPPMTLLPCLMLERLEALARRGGADAAVLLSGQVLAYQGRNYLLPTVYVIPRERTKLIP
jgi:hypothetical protein